MTQLVDWNPVIDPMKRFFFLFQFISTRLSQSDTPAETTCKRPPIQKGLRRGLFLAFRSPNDQQCVIAVPSCDDGTESGFPYSKR
jgi:hypothetical protein